MGIILIYMIIGVSGLILFCFLHYTLAIALKKLVLKYERFASIYSSVAHFLQKYTFMTSLFLFGTALLGMHQAVTFYLLNYAYYWIVVFTLFAYLLLFVFPFGSIILPFFKPQKKFTYGFFLVVGGVTLLWIIALLLQTEPYVVSDAKGREDVSLVVKNIAVILLSINYIIQITYLSQWHIHSGKKHS